MGTSTVIDTYGRNAEERAALRDKIDRANKEAAEHWDDPAWRREMAAETTTAVLEGFEHENLIDILVDVERAPFDGRILVKETRGLKAFWMARGGYIEASTLRQEVMEVPRDQVGFHVYEFEDKLRTGFAETQATLIELGTTRMDAEINLRLLRLFQAAIPVGTPYYIGATGLGLAAVNLGLREVRDATKGREVVIVGRSTMTEQFIDRITNNGTNTGFTPETNEEMLKRGSLGMYRGARIITVINHKDADDVPFWPANELYLMGKDAAKFAFWGGLMSKEYTEQDNWYWHYLARRDVGGVVHHPERARRIIDTSIAP